MPRRLLRAVASRFPDARPQNPVQHAFSVDDIVWAMGSFCALNRKPFDGDLLIRQFRDGSFPLNNPIRTFRIFLRAEVD